MATFKKNMCYKPLVVAINIIILLGINVAYSQNITSPNAIVIPISPYTSYANTGQVANITSGKSIKLGPGTLLSPGAYLTIDKNLATPTAPNNPSADLDKNWIYVRSYDEQGNEIGASKQFFDNNGKATQTQTKNETTGQVLASQTIYDVQGRGVLNTLSAPINNSGFAYRNDFVTHGNTVYSYLNFDGDPTSSNPYQNVTAPDAVDNSTQGTLGWYYSNNNTLEPMVATTSFPYSRNDFYHDGSGAVKSASRVGDKLSMGQGHETTSNSFPVQHELDIYLAIRNQYFGGNTVMGNCPTSMAGMALQSVSTDQNGTSAVVITDLTGKLALMTGRADPSSNAWLTVQNTLSLSNVQLSYSFSVTTTGNSFGSPPGPGNGGLYVDPTAGFSINSANTVNVYQSGSNTPIYTGPGNGFKFTSVIASTPYQITSAYPFFVSAADQTGTAIYDQAEAVFLEPTGAATQYFQVVTPSAINITGSFTLYDMTTSTDVTTAVANSGQLGPGYYKITADVISGSAPNNVTVTYTNKYSDISYNYYNQLGQLVASVAPNGVKQLIPLSGYSGSTLPFATTYNYDLQGRLISTNNPDAGTANFVYRQDGKIRFSQNAYQASSLNSPTGKERFSYTNYDAIGRPIESGEYVTTAGTFATLGTNSTLLEATDVTGGLSGGTTQSAINTYYDALAPIPSGTPIVYKQDVGFLKGEVSYTKNANSTTLYNYDDHGRVTWLIKSITGFTNPITVDYTYDDASNVTKVDYQKNTSAERFIHYYQYDKDERLVNVQTSLDDVTKTQQANYYYYLHGPVKRVEMGNQLQGLDYVYTAQGWLKAINTPTGNTTNDPGQDGPANGFATDAFGMQLEYFPGDYTRTGSNIIPIATGTQNYYNGIIAGMSWQSNKPTTVVSTYGASIQNPTMYTYAYDPKYQYTTSTWGTPAYASSPGTFTPNTANKFQEKGISYDFNGNILAMQHTGSSGSLADNFTYNYTIANTNKLTSVSNAVGPSTYGSYTYDQIGRLSSQTNTTGTTYIKYDVTGKITGIYADAAFTTLKVGYAYDESGNRISSTNNTGSQPITTYYVYDGSGNVLAIYTQAGTSTAAISEVPVYGSDRLGTYFFGANNYVYEIRDNVGSVRVVINANKVNKQADIAQYDDYYPYGSIAQSGGTGYRYDYQGAYSEKDPVTGYNNFQLRMYDSRIGRWLSTDPAGQFASPYEGMGNDPIMSSDPTGGYDTWFGAWVASLFGIRGGVSQNLDPASLNYQQYYYAKSGTPPDDPRGVAAYQEHYGNGSSLYQIDQSLKRQADQLQREAEYDKNPYGLNKINPYTGKRNEVEAIDEVFPVENVALVVATGGGYADVEVESMSEYDLMTKAATKAEKAIGGVGRFAGSEKHRYAEALLGRYQRIYGDRGWSFEYSFNNGVGNRGFLDVHSLQTTTIYDFKFGDAVMGTTQFAKYSRNFPGFTIQTIKPIIP